MALNSDSVTETSSGSEDLQLTIAIPVYNERDAIVRSIYSVLNQSYLPTAEILIIDDGSSDGTLNVLDKLSARHGEIRVLRNSHNMGRAATRTRLLQEARGKYYAMLDADDLWYPTKIERQFEILRENNFDETIMICGNLMHNDLSTGKRRVKNFASGYGSDYSLARLLRGDNIPISQLSLSNTAFLQRVGPFDVRLSRAQDWDFLIRFFLAGGSVKYVDGPPLAYFNFQPAGRNWLEIQSCMQLVIAKYLAQYEANLVDPHKVMDDINKNYISLFKNKS